MTQDQHSSDGSLREDQARLIFEEGFSFSGYERDALFIREGSRYLDVSGASGIDSLSDGRASVMADFDNDGDLDVFLTTLQGDGHLLFRNNVGQDANYLRVVLDDVPGRARDAFGAVVRVRSGGQTITKIKTGGMGYLSQHDPRLIVGLGRTKQVQEIEVTWPDGTVERVAGPFAAGSTVRLRRSGTPAVTRDRPTRLPDPLTRWETTARLLKLTIGQPMPEIPLRTGDGEVTSLRRLQRPGRALLVNLWATWCTPCRAEMPELQSLLPRLAEAGIDLVGVSVDTNAAVDLAGFAKRVGATYPVFFGGEAAVSSLYATDEVVVPVTVHVDEGGLVSDILPGWSETTRERFLRLASSRPHQP